MIYETARPQTAGVSRGTAPSLAPARELVCGDDNGRQRCDRYPHSDRVHSAVLGRYVGGEWDGLPSGSVSWGSPRRRAS